MVKNLKIQTSLTIVMNMVLIIIVLPPRTPQQNGVVEHKNRTLEDMTRIMLIASGLLRNFLTED